MGEGRTVGVLGHVVLDYIFELPRLPEPNTSIQIEGRQRYFGGTAGNLARWAARLGVPTTLASFVGEGFPEDYREALEADGVDLTDLVVVGGYETPTAWIFSDPEGNQIAVVDQGPMRDAARFAVPDHTLRAADIVHLGTGRPEYYRRVAGRAREAGKTVALDPSQEIHYVYDGPALRPLLDAATYFFGNEAEVGRALQLLRLVDPADLLAFVDVVVMTRGKAGSTVYTATGSTAIPRFEPDRLVDVTGAGDAFRAGFYAALIRGEDAVGAALAGSAAASFAVETKGPQTAIPTWEAVVARLETASPI